MSASLLESALRALGHACRIEGRERLAIIVVDVSLGADALRDLRRDALHLAHAHGFSHVALEIPLGAPVHAGVPRD